MKNTGKIFLLALIIGIMFVLPASAQKTRSDFQKMYMTYLNKQGYNPKIDEDGDVLFKIKGDSYFIIVNEKDPQLFEIICVINMENTPMQKSLEAANYANRNSDCACVYISKDGKFAIITVITLLIKPADWQKLFPRIIDLIDDTEGTFASQLR